MADITRVTGVKISQSDYDSTIESGSPSTVFRDCDLSGLSIHANVRGWPNTRFEHLHFIGCSMIQCTVTALHAQVTRCDLSYADFTGIDFAGIDFAVFGSDFSGCTLFHAQFARPIPFIRNIDQRILEAIEKGGQLKMSEWHTCKTSHCRAGWAIHLAGDAGYELERQTNPVFAGTLIYGASRDAPVPNFYDLDYLAMASLIEDAKAYKS